MSEFRSITCAAALVAATCLAPVASAAVIAADDFSGYANGALIPQSVAKTGFSGAWASNNTLTASVPNDVVVAPNAGNARQELNVATAPAASAVAYRALSTPISDTAGATYYVSFNAQNTNGGTRFFGVSLFSGGSEKMLIGQVSGATSWALSGIVAPVTPPPAFDSTVASTLVAKIVMGGAGSAEQVTLWVDPDLGESEISAANEARRVGTFTTNGDFGNLNRIRLGGGTSNATQGYATHWVDDLSIYQQVGANDSVFASVPEPTSLAAIGAGFAVLLRRRRAV